MLLMSVGMNVQASGTKKALSGTVACGGSQFIRNGGNEFHQASYIMRNFDGSAEIHIERIRFFDATGNLVADFPGTSLPEFTNGILGPQDNVLETNQTAQLGTRNVFGDQGFSSSDRPLQVLIDWNSISPVKPLNVSMVRSVRERIVKIDATGNQIVKYGEERSRHRSACRVIELQRY